MLIKFTCILYPPSILFILSLPSRSQSQIRKFIGDLWKVFLTGNRKADGWRELLASVVSRNKKILSPLGTFVKELVHYCSCYYLWLDPVSLCCPMLDYRSEFC